MAGCCLHKGARARLSCTHSVSLSCARRMTGSGVLPFQVLPVRPPMTSCRGSMEGMDGHNTPEAATWPPVAVKLAAKALARPFGPGISGCCTVMLHDLLQYNVSRCKQD